MDDLIRVPLFFLTDVTYTCGLGRRLFKFTKDETIIYESKTLHCEWNRTWSPDAPVSENIDMAPVLVSVYVIYKIPSPELMRVILIPML
jgi:hypothetical protein